MRKHVPSMEAIDALSKRGDLTAMKWPSAIRRAIAGFKIVPAPLRKLIVGVIGGTIVLIGIAMIVLPGPAFIVIPVGLGILATEFAWARRTVRRASEMIAKARGRKPEKAGP